MKPLRPLLGRVCVVLVFVDGPDSASIDELTRITAYTECAAGLGVLGNLAASWGARQSPPVAQPCTFALTGRPVTIGVDPRSLPARTGNKPLDWKRIDRVWLDATLTALGVPTGGDFDDRMRGVAAGLAVSGWTWLGIDDIVPVFVTNYPTHWMAYADGYRRYATINVPETWAKWTTSKHRVFAHELGHVFGAPDEYAKSTCTVTETAGPFATPNANCTYVTRVPLVPNPFSVDCLMNRNSAVACPSTEFTWGWLDADGDGETDLLAYPTVTAVDPRAVQAGQAVTLTGRNLWDVVEVDFNGTVTSDVNYIRLDGSLDPIEAADPEQKYHLDQISVTVPPTADGIQEVRVHTRGGWSPSAPQDDWLLVVRPGSVPVLTEPAVLSLDPASGPPGQSVTIIGANLLHTTDVTIGGYPALDVDAFNDSYVSFTVPPKMPPGPVDVVAITPTGQSSPWLFSTFEVT